MEGNLNPNRFHFNEFILYDFWPRFSSVPNFSSWTGLRVLTGPDSSDELMCSSCCDVEYTQSTVMN